jgi:hypothetical protein
LKIFGEFVWFRVARKKLVSFTEIATKTTLLSSIGKKGSSAGCPPLLVLGEAL